MNAFELKHIVLLAIPFLLIPSAALVFITLAKWLGKEIGYLLGFLFYWTVWCLFAPLILLGTHNKPAITELNFTHCRPIPVKTTESNFLSK